MGATGTVAPVVGTAGRVFVVSHAAPAFAGEMVATSIAAAASDVMVHDQVLLPLLTFPPYAGYRTGGGRAQEYTKVDSDVERAEMRGCLVPGAEGAPNREPPPRAEEARAMLLGVGPSVSTLRRASVAVMLRLERLR
jgi:hypothetical protein